MKSWKEILNADLGSLFRRGAASPEPPLYWWTRLARLFRGQSGERHQRDGRALARGARPASWKGPIYWNMRLWRRDVVLVSEYIRSLIACNAPLAPGFAAAAREEVRARTAWTPQRVSTATRTALAIVLLLALGTNIAMDSNGLDSGPGFLQAIIMVCIAAWLIRAVCANRSSRQGVFQAMERRIASGSGLSEAMASLPRFFPRHLVDLVEAGEASGNLDPAFDQFSDSMLHSLGLQRQLRATFSYLGVMLLAQLTVASFLLVKVMPVFAEIRQEMGPDAASVEVGGTAAAGMFRFIGTILPNIDGLIRLGDHIFSFGPVLIALVLLVGLVILFGRFGKRRSWSGRRSAGLLFLVPWFRGLTVRHNLGLISLMLHGLLRAGVPLDRALAMALGSDVHPAYRRWLGALRERVCQGESLKEALQTVPSRGLIPESFRGLVEAGERSGQLPETFGRVADLYRRDTEKRLRVLHALVLPAGILVLGYLVLATQVSVFRVLIELAGSIHA